MRVCYMMLKILSICSVFDKIKIYLGGAAVFNWHEIRKRKRKGSKTRPHSSLCELPHRRPHAGVRFQKCLSNPCRSLAPPLAGRGNNRPKSEF